MSWRYSQSSEQHLHLLFFGPRRKQRSACKNFIDEAAQTPNIDFVIIRFHQHNFRRAIVATLYISKLLVVRKAG